MAKGQHYLIPAWDTPCILLLEVTIWTRIWLVQRLAVFHSSQRIWYRSTDLGGTECVGVLVEIRIKKSIKTDADNRRHSPDYANTCHYSSFIARKSTSTFIFLQEVLQLMVSIQSRHHRPGSAVGADLAAPDIMADWADRQAESDNRRSHSVRPRLHTPTASGHLSVGRRSDRTRAVPHSNSTYNDGRQLREEPPPAAPLQRAVSNTLTSTTYCSSIFRERACLGRGGEGWPLGCFDIARWYFEILRTLSHMKRCPLGSHFRKGRCWAKTYLDIPRARNAPKTSSLACG